MAKEQMQIEVIGMSWFEADEYNEVLSVMADRHVLHGTYPEWLAAATATFERLQRSGKVVVKATIHPKPFADWCRQRNLNIDANARMLWGNVQAKAWLDARKDNSSQ